MTFDMSTWRTGCYLTLFAAHFTNINLEIKKPRRLSEALKSSPD